MPLIAGAAPAVGGAYVEAVVGQPRYLNPLLAPLNETDEDVVALAFAGLTRVDSTGRVQPDLAESWGISPDGLSYTFQLAAGLHWSDGDGLDADDVIFTIRSIQDPGFAGPRSLASLWNEVKFEKIDAATVRLLLPSPRPTFLEQAALGLIPSHILGKVPAGDLPGHDFNARPVGAGPYRVVSAALERVTLEINPHYYGRTPYLARIEFRYFRGEAAFPTPIEGLGLRRALGQSVPSPTYTAPNVGQPTLLVFNLRTAPFDEVALRRAVALVLDPTKVAEAALGERGIASSSLIAPGSPIYSKRGEIARDARRAAEALDAAGWRAVAGQKARQRQGQSLAFTLLTNDQPEHVRVAEEISRQLAAVGFGVEVKSAAWTSLIEESLAPHRFQAVVLTHSSPTAEPDLYAFWHSSQAASGLNLGGFASGPADDLLARSRRLTRQDERAKLFADLQALFADRVPAVPLYYPTYAFAAPPEIQGIRLGLLLRPADRFADVAEWYTLTRAVPRAR